MLQADNLLLKLLMAPLIIAAATLVARQWGENIGGLMVGLPLTSGPVSVFFALEQGPKFAAHAALGAISGLIPVAVFCSAYARTAKHFSWRLAATFSILLYLVTVWGMSQVDIGLIFTTLLVAGVLFASLFIIGRLDFVNTRFASPWWDLPLRIVVATTLLVLITTSAGALGSKWSGLLSPFPIFTFVMATFTHHQAGPPAARRLIRGVVTGLFAYLAFFLVVILLVEGTSLVITYLVAAFAALAVNGLSLLRLVHRTTASHSQAQNL